ncbi:uncharacterized protein K460DRAFT_362508 [Cucurbitaria berberidis CBS 394.84]|uniref:Uncharacterized protein n=1 Tax=Cucurbitaria berberidis CBS 394.84 TaxID=1168544 RepID=A0A9P4GUG5_9PLEO|nr:uncharacterized protein K460DRAFT_362508 [Cucurbitaria berberidis CBS 394.84]KAF1851761.1 hypothetical protein K460DRAFT_362508 [Cucurbitaria berberidis CBS 394.84]
MGSKSTMRGEKPGYQKEGELDKIQGIDLGEISKGKRKRGGNPRRRPKAESTKQDSDSGAAENTIARKKPLDIATPEGIEDHGRRKNESEREATGREKKVMDEKRYRKHQKNNERRAAKRQGNAILEKQGISSGEQTSTSGDATTSQGSGKDEEAVDDDDDFDIDIYGDEETRRKYGKVRKFA